MGFGFLFGFHARTMGRGRHHRAVALSSPTKAGKTISYRHYKIKIIATFSSICRTYAVERSESLFRPPLTPPPRSRDPLGQAGENQL